MVTRHPAGLRADPLWAGIPESSVKAAGVLCVHQAACGLLCRLKPHCAVGEPGACDAKHKGAAPVPGSAAGMGSAGLEQLSAARHEGGTALATFHMSTSVSPDEACPAEMPSCCIARPCMEILNVHISPG